MLKQTMIMMVMGLGLTTASVMASPSAPVAPVAPVGIDAGALVLPPSAIEASVIGDDDAAPIAMRGGHEIEMCVTVAEHDAAVAHCPGGRRIVGIAFASYGTPEGSCPRFAVGACHARGSRRIAEQQCVGREHCSLPADNQVFGDPCEGTVKRLSLQYVCR